MLFESAGSLERPGTKDSRAKGTRTGHPKEFHQFTDAGEEYYDFKPPVQRTFPMRLRGSCLGLEGFEGWFETRKKSAEGRQTVDEITHCFVKRFKRKTIRLAWSLQSIVWRFNKGSLNAFVKKMWKGKKAYIYIHKKTWARHNAKRMGRTCAPSRWPRDLPTTRRYSRVAALRPNHHRMQSEKKLLRKRIKTWILSKYGKSKPEE